MIAFIQSFAMKAGVTSTVTLLCLVNMKACLLSLVLLRSSLLIPTLLNPTIIFCLSLRALTKKQNASN